MPYELPFEPPAMPGFYLRFNNELALGDPDQPHRAVVVGTKLAAGTVLQHVPKQIRTSNDADEFFGQGSMVAEMARIFIANSKVELWAIGIDEEAGGTAAAGEVAISGSATAAGELVLRIAGTRIRVPVAKDAAAATVIADAVSTVNDKPSLPLSASDGVTKVDLTCKWKGASGNDVDVRFDPDAKIPAGLTVTITEPVGGATDPEIDTALAQLGDVQYHTVAIGYRDQTNLDHLDAWLRPRWGETQQTEGQAFVGHTGSYSDLTTLAGSNNSEFITVAGPGPSPSPPWLWAAAVASDDAELTKLSPNTPRLGRVLEGLRPPAQEDRFRFDERNTLLVNGIATFNADANGRVAVEKLVTLYTQNSGGFSDDSYSLVSTMRTLSRLRFDLRVLRYRYKDWRIADDETLSNASRVLTPKRLRKALILWYAKERDQNQLVQDLKGFAADLIVQVDQSGVDMVAFLPVRLVYPLSSIASEMAYI